MPLPLTVSCFSKIQIGFNFLAPAHPGSPGKRAVKRVCVCMYVCVKLFARSNYGTHTVCVFRSLNARTVFSFLCLPLPFPLHPSFPLLFSSLRPFFSSIFPSPYCLRFLFTFFLVLCSLFLFLSHLFPSVLAYVPFLFPLIRFLCPYPQLQSFSILLSLSLTSPFISPPLSIFTPISFRRRGRVSIDCNFIIRMLYMNAYWSNNGLFYVTSMLCFTLLYVVALCVKMCYVILCIKRLLIDWLMLPVLQLPGAMLGVPDNWLSLKKKRLFAFYSVNDDFFAVWGSWLVVGNALTSFFCFEHGTLCFLLIRVLRSP